LHKILREAVTNTCVHADFYGRRGLVIQKKVDGFVFSNPGSMRVAKRVAVEGGVSDPRNGVMLKIFSLVDYGERAGSGLSSIMLVWEHVFHAAAKIEEEMGVERVVLTLNKDGHEQDVKAMLELYDNPEELTIVGYDTVNDKFSSEFIACESHPDTQMQGNDPQKPQNDPQKAVNDPQNDTQKIENDPQNNPFDPQKLDNDPQRLGDDPQNDTQKIENDPQNKLDDPQNQGDDPQKLNKDPQNSKNDTQMDGNNTQFDPQNRELLILGIIRETPTIGKEGIASKLNVSEATIKRGLRSLRKSFRVEWVGGTRNGHWEVSEK